MPKEKKKWEMPNLICLYRGRPEEAVLAICKAPNGVGPNAPTICAAQDKCSTPAGT